MVRVERVAQLTAILALLILLTGLVVLALPDGMEGRQLLSLDAAHSLHVADLVGALLVAMGAALAWVAVLVWQRRTLRQ